MSLRSSHPSISGSRIVTTDINYPAMPAGAISKLPFISSPIATSMFSSPGLSLGLQTCIEGEAGETGGRIGGDFEPVGGRSREEDYESRSGSDNLDGGSCDDQDIDNPPRKRRYHRHTPQQIQELEALFKECPHPDEKQRMELSKRLCLESRQIKFWFQNRRTQMKIHLERHENLYLRQENDKLRTENMSIGDAMRNPVCSNCGGPAVFGEMSLEEQHLRVENARLKYELDRVSALAGKFLGRSASSSMAPALPMSSSSLELSVGSNGFGCSNIIIPATLSPGPDFGCGVSSTVSGGAAARPMNVIGSELSPERSVFLELALASMDELIKIAQNTESLWLPGVEGGKEILNYEEYQRMFMRCVGAKPARFVTEASRETGIVIINSLALVETLMDANRWAEMFPCVIARTSTTDVISKGLGGSRNGTLQLMRAELQVLSPLVPIRELNFLRFCKQHADGVWAVVDVSIDGMRENPNASPYMNSRKLPSGCIVQDLGNGYSKVDCTTYSDLLLRFFYTFTSRARRIIDTTHLAQDRITLGKYAQLTWVEHVEYDETAIHHLYRPLIRSGMGFGAHRWVATLQRQCECFAILTSSSAPHTDQAGITPSGQRSMLKLARRMMGCFCAGVCASTAYEWSRLQSRHVHDDVRVMTRKSMDDPGEPAGVVLSAATSVWLPVSPPRLFDFVRDERLRSEWDILSNGGPMQEMAHVAKRQGRGNCVSLLRANAMSASQSSMLILQETCTDSSGSLVVYAPVDIPAMQAVMNGDDSTHVALLPSGFVILPDGGGPRNRSNSTTKMDGSLLTVAFQIVVNSLPTAKLTVESVETVNNLISCTVQKIKTALRCDT